MTEVNWDDEADALGAERHLLAFQRTCNKLGIEYSFTDEGVLQYEGDEEAGESEEFIDAFQEELSSMIVNDAFAKLHAEGIIEPASVDPETGEVDYKLADGVDIHDYLG